jgi:HSP20 family protein
MNRFASRSFGSDLNSMLAGFFDNEIDLPRQDFAPAVDIIENETSFSLKAEIPGIKKEDIKLEIKDNTLIISGERKFDKEEKRDNYHRIERSYGSFTRSFLLPNNVDSEKVDAKLEEGVLNVTLHKKSENKPLGIKIQ